MCFVCEFYLIANDSNYDGGFFLFLSFLISNVNSSSFVHSLSGGFVCSLRLISSHYSHSAHTKKTVTQVWHRKIPHRWTVKAPTQANSQLLKLHSSHHWLKVKRKSPQFTRNSHQSSRQTWKPPQQPPPAIRDLHPFPAPRRWKQRRLGLHSRHSSNCRMTRRACSRMASNAFPSSLTRPARWTKCHRNRWAAFHPWSMRTPMAIRPTLRSARAAAIPAWIMASTIVWRDVMSEPQAESPPSLLVENSLCSPPSPSFFFSFVLKTDNFLPHQRKSRKTTENI